MRQLEPFSYFADHASAVAGFGGAGESPDPRYFFHTHYEAVRPGRAVYRLAIRRPRVTAGELTLRIHAHKPGGTGEIALAGGAVVALDEVERDADQISLPIRFAAATDTHYALYGFFSEPTDLVAEAIDITIEELGGAVDASGAGARRSGRGDTARGFAASNKLCTERPPSLSHPVSQPCTRDQIAAATFDGLWPAIPRFAEDPALRWMLVLPLQALASAGLLATGARGLVLDAPHAALAETLRAAGCTIDESGAPDPDGEAGYDFVIGYEPGDGSDMASATATLPERLVVHAASEALTVAMLSFDGAETRRFRNDIQRIALRLIGRGHDVAQLCFAPAASCVTRSDGRGVFAFITRV